MVNLSLPLLCHPLQIHMYTHMTVVEIVGYYYFAEPQRVIYRHHGHLIFFLIKTIFFRAVLSHSKLDQKVQRFSIYSLPLHMHSILPHWIHIHPSQWSGSCIIIDESTLTHHNHPKYIVYNMVHSWCCIFYGFRQMYNEWYVYHYSIIQYSLT